MDTKKDKKKEKQRSQDKIKELTDTLKRVQADFENYRKQVEKRIGDIRKTASKHLLLNLLPILDHLDLALKHTQDPEEFKAGVEMIHQQLMSSLEQEGLKKIDAQDQLFDMQQHEAIEKVQSNKKENIVVEITQEGYILHDKVLRVAKVKVSTGKDQQKEVENQ